MDYRAEIQKGDIVTIREENGDIKLITQHQALVKVRALANKYLTDDNSVDDFLRWRKEEAIAEDDKMNKKA